MAIGIGEHPIDDGDDGIVVFGQMIQQHSIARPAIIVRHARCLQSDGPEESVLVGQIDKLEALLDGSLDPRAIRANISQELSELARFENELAERFMAE